MLLRRWSSCRSMSLSGRRNNQCHCEERSCSFRRSNLQIIRGLLRHSPFEARGSQWHLKKELFMTVNQCDAIIIGGGDHGKVVADYHPTAGQKSCDLAGEHILHGAGGEGEDLTKEKINE